MELIINGQTREIAIADGSGLAQLVEALGLKGDRIAVEQNGSIVPRAEWPSSSLRAGDRIEMVHFVGGGAR